MAEKVRVAVLPTTPINYEAEQALLGSLLMDVNVANEFTTLLCEKDFAMSQNNVIFKAIFELNQDNQPIDALTVADKLTLKNKLNDAGGMEYISQLVTSIPSTANAEHYFDIVKRDSLRRDIISAGNEIVKNAQQSDSGKKALDFAERKIFSISEEHESTRLEPVIKAATEAYNKIKSIQIGEFIDDGIKSGFSNLDSIISSFPKGALCMIAARPSVGKTAFALSVAVNASIKQGKTVALFSLEMPSIQLVQRMLTTLSGVPFSKQTVRNKMDMNDTSKMFRAHEALTTSKIFVDDNSYNTPADIISKCRRLKNTVGLDMVIIDYLQLMTLGEQKENRQQEVATMSRMMKIYAKELNIPFLVLSQMSRAAEQRGDEPKLSDLRESGSIEQDADMVMFLHRPKRVDNPKGKEAMFINNFDEGKLIKMLVSKNRNGRIADTFFKWDGDRQTYTPIEFSYDDVPEVAVKVNTDVTKLEQINNSMSDSPFDDLLEKVPVVSNGTESEINESNGNADMYAAADFDDVPPPQDEDLPF